MKKVVMDANEAVGEISYLFTEVASIYPITPSSPMAEHVEVLRSRGVKNFWGHTPYVIEMQSEAGASGVLHGVLQAGSYATTYTASQGLLLMIPNMYKMAGELLPCVMHVAARSLSTHALSILGDHQDVYATRMTGFALLASSSVSEAGDMAAVAHLSAMKSGMPFLHFFDGFRTSHELDTIRILEKEDLEPLLPKKEIDLFRSHSLIGKEPYTVGTNQNDDIYFQATEARNSFYDALPDIVESYMKEINKIKGTNYQPFTYYGSSVASHVIVAMGSVCETIKETVDVLNNQGYQVGCVTVYLYRPFSVEHLKAVLPKTVEKIAVLDRTKESGSVGEPLYLDVKSALGSDIPVYGGRYGLSSKNTTPAQIKAVYDFLRGESYHNFTIGIYDDVTHLSLPVDHNFTIHTHQEYRIYGYGSDGMVSLSKSFLKVIDAVSDEYVQGYFQYDSKKSGGVTISHLRTSSKPIHSTYYVEHPKVVVISKDSYLQDFSCFEGIEPNGIVLINTAREESELQNQFTYHDKKLLLDSNATVYFMNAYELARKLGLNDKISMIMESALFSILNDFDHDSCIHELEKYIHTRFKKYGANVVDANLKSLREAPHYLNQIALSLENSDEVLEIPDESVIYALHKRVAGDLPTSAFLKHPDGKFYYRNKGTMERGISNIVPSWLMHHCIQCNQCSFVCPHSVIRPFLLSQEEYDNAPEMIKSRAVKAMPPIPEGYYFMIAVSVKNCTGCGLCIKTCPAREKALMPISLKEGLRNREDEIFDYAVNHISQKEVTSKYTVKGSQFCYPKFEFCGACAGCGETAYIKLLTQLYGDQLVIANATGCSSIYGASVPSLPYQISWGSSLFEDNAEYGYGILLSLKNKIESLNQLVCEYPDETILNDWQNHRYDLEKTKVIYEKLKNLPLPEELEARKGDFLVKTVWCIGGDGWAYDIGFGGIDHILSRKDNINILVLDTEVYSNTGGQSSKATPTGSIAGFASTGKKTAKKDLSAMMMLYPHVYVATIALGASMNQAVKVLKEAAMYDGPSLVIAYAPCISHGLIGGMSESMKEEQLAVSCGYFPLFHRDPIVGKLILDFKNVDFGKYEDYLNMQLRYQMLKEVNPTHAEELLNRNKQEAIARFQYYQSLE